MRNRLINAFSVLFVFVLCWLNAPEAAMAADGDEGGSADGSGFRPGRLVREKRIEYRAEERFAMASTFKLLLTGAVLHRVEKGEERMDRAVPYGDADLLEYAPVAKAHISEGALTVEALCAAMMEYSEHGR
jgi:beta-lactamase class A